MSGDLLPSYLFKTIAICLIILAIMAEGRDRTLLLIAAYCAVSIAWLISTRLANRWFWLWKSRDQIDYWHKND